jgi:glycosyltransferase involved in cell wall biosynthesis
MCLEKNIEVYFMIKVSIIVPCYNQAQYLDEALQSVLDQTYIHWECIIVNDGSPDSTEEVAKQWAGKDSRFVYLKKENGGLSSARNFGIAYAKGEFILPLDADDKISNDYVALALNAFQQDTSLKVVYCKAERFGDEDGLWQLQPFSLIDLARYNMIFCSAIYRKRDWQLVNGYDINMIYGLEDWEFWIAILKKGGAVKCLDIVGFYYRIRSGSMTRIINLEERNFLENYVAKKHIEFFMYNYDVLNKNKKDIDCQLKSEKFVINLFTKMFLGFKFLK